MRLIEHENPGVFSELGGRQLEREELQRLYSWAPSSGSALLRGLMISSVDGSAVDADGRSGGLGTAADQTIFSLQRDQADAVLVGAGTVVAEKYSGLTRSDGSPGPALCVLSARGDLPPMLSGDRRGTPGPIVVVTTEEGAKQGAPGADGVWVCGETELDFSVIRARLAQEGWPRVLCEGGPTTLARALGAGAVDELSLTLSPRLVGGAGPRIVDGPPLNLDASPRFVLSDGRGTMLALYTVTPGGKVGPSD